MSGSSGVLRKVLRLKLQLKESTGPETVLKTLQKLGDLGMTLDILTESGIGKLVNSLRRHEVAGELAKSLVKGWKKLLSDTSESHSEVSAGMSQTYKLDDREDDFNNNDLTSKRVEREEEVTHRKENRKRKKEVENGERHPCGNIQKVEREKSTVKDSKRSKCEHSPRSSQRVSLQKPLTHLSADKGAPKRKHKKDKTRSRELSGSEADPSLSFESFLNYDQHLSNKRQKKTPKKSEATKKSRKTSEDVGADKSLRKNVKASSPQKSSVDNLINVPLPAVLLDCENSTFDYYERKGAPFEKKSPDVPAESTIFPGQRLNKKMQVYSGAKTMFLPAMMSLYQQCIRTLQNNIDLLYETGGVPFEVLEPVLDRCTPEQLLRIEEFNPLYIGETDHLWGKHCQRDFKDSKLLEYESWKEMYIRLSEEREMKFQRLKRTIASAHSKKPQGRQVKMAFIHSVAKPPRDVRIQQELHGTAAQQPVSSVKTRDNSKSVHKTEPPKTITAPAASSSSTQDPRKKTKVAPMMAKSLKAFKKQMGRR